MIKQGWGNPALAFKEEARMSNSTGAMTQDEIIMELMDLLKKNQMNDKANDVFEAASYIDGLQNKLDRVMEELVTVKQQLSDIQIQNERKSLKDVLSEMVVKMENRCGEMKQQLLEVKEDFKAKAGSVIDGVKQKGKEALHNMQEFFGIKGKLEKMRVKVKESIADAEHTIGRIDAFGKGMREASQQIANTVRTFADKETVDYSKQEKPFSKTEAFKKPWEIEKRLLESMELRLDAAIDKMDDLSRDVELGKMEDKDVSLEETRLSDGKEPAMLNVADNSYAYGSDAFEAYQQQSKPEKTDISKVVEPAKKSR